MSDHPPGPPGRLVALRDAGHILAHATSAEVVKDLRDKAEAVRQYAKSAKLGLPAQNAAAETRLRAERKVGEMLAALRLHGGRRKSKATAVTLKLSDLGVSRMQSVRWQRTAAIPNEHFEAYLREAVRLGKEITAAGLYRYVAQQPSRKKPSRRRPSRRKAGRPPAPIPSEILQEMTDDLELLTRLLAPVCKSERPKLEQCEREHIARLLTRIAEVVKTVAGVQPK
jgi:hypothetical protein